MKILFLTDIHIDLCESPSKISNMIEKLSMHNPDLILVGGDFQTKWPNEMEQSDVEGANQTQIDSIISQLQKIAKTFYVLGNHDCVYKHKSEQYLQTVTKIADNLYIVPQSGSSSSMIHDRELDVYNAFWGYPYGPLSESQNIDDFQKYQQPLLKGNKEQISRIEKDILIPNFNCSCAYNQNQVVNFELSDGQFILLSHQGPYSSTTSADICHDTQFSSGSPALQQFYNQYCDQIVLWFHGHTHYPKYNKCKQMVNPGPFVKGNYCLVELSDKNRLNKWTITDVQILKIEQ